MRQVARHAVNALVGERRRVVRVLGGVARGARLELDLRSQKAYWTGRYERALQRALREHVRSGDVVYDVGAHHGFFSICAARLGARTFAFEPDPENARVLRTNVGLNQADVEVVESAVWDRAEGVRLVGGDWDSEWRTQTGGSVPAVTLDEFAEVHEPPTFVKVDVEGSETRVLRGASRVLREARPVVVCELHGAEARAGVLELLAGYDVSQLGGEWRVLAVPRPS